VALVPQSGGPVVAEHDNMFWRNLEFLLAHHLKGSKPGCQQEFNLSSFISSPYIKICFQTQIHVDHHPKKLIAVAHQIYAVAHQGAYRPALCGFRHACMQNNLCFTETH
jgi:hypothetical protein